MHVVVTIYASGLRAVEPLELLNLRLGHIVERIYQQRIEENPGIGVPMKK
jgi:hypothetical protein